MPKEAARGSPTTWREKLAEIGAKVAAHGRYVTFQMAEVAVPRDPFQKILRRIDELRPQSLATSRAERKTEMTKGDV